MAPARYSDKSLACDLIIITTPFNPVDFYDEIFDDIKKIPMNRQQRRKMPKNMDNPDELKDVVKGPALVVVPIAVYQ